MESLKRKYDLWIWRSLGFLLLGVGALGVVLPLLPTTIFWILAALCFARSDPKIRDWIYARPHFGEQVERFVEHGQMTPASKRGALFGISLALPAMTFVLWQRWLLLAGGVVLVLIGAAYVLSRPEPEEEI